MHTITSVIRGGGSGHGAWVAKITGTDAMFGLSRQFVKKGGSTSRSGRSGHFEWTLTEPGLYELRGLQYEKGEATIGALDNGFLVLSADGSTRRIEKAEAIEIARGL